MEVLVEEKTIWIGVNIEEIIPEISLEHTSPQIQIIYKGTI